MFRAFLISVLVLGFTVSAGAQECTTEDQAALDLCVSDGITTCRDLYSSECERHAATEEGAISRFLDRCCTKKNENPRTRGGFVVCKRTFLRGTRPTQRLFGAEFARSIRDEIRALSYDDCTQ